MAALAEALSALDRAAKAGAIHPNAAARRKSRLTRKVNAALGGEHVQTGGRVVKTTGKAAAAKAAKARIAAGKAGKAKGAQTAAGKARAALSKTARAEAAAAKAAAEAAPTRRRRGDAGQGDRDQGRGRQGQADEGRAEEGRRDHEGGTQGRAQGDGQGRPEGEEGRDQGVRLESRHATRRRPGLAGAFRFRRRPVRGAVRSGRQVGRAPSRRCRRHRGFGPERRRTAPRRRGRRAWSGPGSSPARPELLAPVEAA